MYKKLIVLLALASYAATSSSETLLVSGEIAAKNKQVFSVPKADSWQVKIDWMIEEGSQVKTGDTVVIYDSSSLLTDVEQLEAQVRQAIAQRDKSQLSNELALREAIFSFEQAQLNLEKARLDAQLPEQNLSKLDYSKYQLAKNKASQQLGEMKNKLSAKRLEVSNEGKRQEINVLQSKADMARKQSMIDGMMQKAQAGGTALYVTHPWNGSKINAGDTVQRNFTVLEIPNTENLQVVAWLNEVDIAKISLNQSVELTVDALPLVNVKGRVVKISKQAEVKKDWGSAAYFSLEIELDNSQNLGILPGMSVLASIESIKESS